MRLSEDGFCRWCWVNKIFNFSPHTIFSMPRLMMPYKWNGFYCWGAKRICIFCTIHPFLCQCVCSAQKVMMSWVMSIWKHLSYTFTFFFSFSCTILSWDGVKCKHIHNADPLQYTVLCFVSSIMTYQQTISNILVQTM